MQYNGAPHDRISSNEIRFLPTRIPAAHEPTQRGLGLQEHRECQRIKNHDSTTSTIRGHVKSSVHHKKLKLHTASPLNSQTTHVCSTDVQISRASKRVSGTGHSLKSPTHSWVLYHKRLSVHYKLNHYHPSSKSNHFFAKT